MAGAIMQTYNIHEAKTQLSRLVEMAARGESFVIAKSGKPMVKVTALDTPEPSQRKRFGFMAGQIKVPDDFNTMGGEEIQKLFEDED
jgi:antitoxin (DNA-binding transcriptional repressor) of toxin-antitoxin stability system